MEIVLKQLVYFGFFQSILLLCIYFFSPKNSTRIHGYMAFFIGIISIGLIGKVLYSLGVWSFNFRLISLSELSALLFGPTIFLFTRSILKKVVFFKKDLLHYLPGAAYSVFVAFYFVLVKDDVLIAKSKTGELIRVIYACHAVGLIVNTIYWVKAWQLFRVFSLNIQNELSYEPQIRFLVRFLIITGFFLLVWIFILSISLFGFTMLERNARPYIWILLSLIILFITCYLIIYPQALKIGNFEKEGNHI